MSAPDEVVLYIDRNDSTCSACGKTCMPYEPTHTTPCGWDQHPGCGATYTHISTHYFGDGSMEAARRMRPDLTPVEWNWGAER